jgi:hypothetical protein
MSSYLVQWEINIDADSPVEAAKEAWRIQLDISSTATVFKVVDEETDKVEQIDLEE